MSHERSRLLERVSAPASEPLTLTETKLYLRVDNSDEDTIITDMIVAARMAAEHYLKRSLITQSWKLAFDEYLPEKTLLPLGPVGSITSVKTVDRTGAEQTLTSNAYYLNAAKDTLVLDSVLVAFRVEVVYQTGYGVASDVPQAIRQAMMAHISAMYDERGMDCGIAIPEKALVLYAPYRGVKL